MDFEIDENILLDFSQQVGKEHARIAELIKELKECTTHSELFEEAGQIADRIYGAVAMFKIENFATYCQRVKEMAYKCSKTDPDHDIARQKCLTIINEFSEDMLFIRDNISVPKQILLKDRHYKTMISRAERILNSYLYSINVGSCDFEDDQQYIFIYDKSVKLELFYKQSGKQLIPMPKFFNAVQGFQKAFDKERESVYGVVIDTSDDAWVGIIKNIRMYDPVVPIIVTSRTKRGIERVDIKKLQIQGLMIVSGNLSKVIERFDKVYKSRGSIIKDSPEQVGDINVSQNIDDYIAVSTKVFKSGVPSPFDVFLQLSSKLVKVIKKNEPFDQTLVDRHIEKGVNKYFISKEEHSAFLDLFDEEVQNIYNDSSIGFSQKKESFLEYADDVHFFLEEKGLEEETMEHAKQFVQTSENLVSQACEEHDGLKDLLDGITDLEHSASVCLLAGLFLKYINAKSSIYNDIALACFLHDVGLIGQSEIVRSGYEDLMSEDEKKIFYGHPKLGALKLVEVGLKPALVEAVKQHHMYYDGSGFPKLKNGEALNPIAEVIALSNDLLDIIEQVGDSDDPIKVFKNERLTHFSPKIQNVFNYAFK